MHQEESENTRKCHFQSTGWKLQKLKLQSGRCVVGAGLCLFLDNCLHLPNSWCYNKRWSLVKYPHIIKLQESLPPTYRSAATRPGCCVTSHLLQDLFFFLPWWLLLHAARTACVWMSWISVFCRRFLARAGESANGCTVWCFGYGRWASSH